LIEGLKAGILAKAQEVISAVTNLISDIVGAAKMGLQEQSESKIGVQIGADFDRGIITGLASLAPMVSAQMQAVVQAPAQAMLGGGGSISSDVTNNFNLTTNSTTRPGGLAMEFQTMSFASR